MESWSGEGRGGWTEAVWRREEGAGFEFCPPPPPAPEDRPSWAVDVTSLSLGFFICELASSVYFPWLY